jgi:ribose-phosphate pyrophosphokinase
MTLSITGTTRTLLAGTAHPALAQSIATTLGQQLAVCVIKRFPDGEMHVEIESSVRGHDVYLIQPTSPPIEAHLLELLLIADACRRAGAARLTAIIPYFGYARQDRRATGREPVGARLIADLLAVSGLQRIVAVDLHTAALEGFFTIPLEHLSAVPLLANAMRPLVAANCVIAAPDLGAVKRAEHYGSLLHLPVTIVHKTRLSGDEVRVGAITGEVQGRIPLLVDDMISTAGTMAEAATALRAAGCVPDITVVASHGLFVGPAARRLRSLPLKQIIVTDSVALSHGLDLPLQVVGLGRLLAEAIGRLHADKSLSDYVMHE